MLLKRSSLHFLFLLVFSWALDVSAQEELGFVNSNYAGVNSLFINPSFMVDSKIFVDVHLIGMDAFIHNNLMYMPRPDYSPLQRTFPDPLLNDADVNKKAFAKIDLIGPSIAVSYNTHSFGVFTRLRTFMDAKMTRSLFVLALKDFDYKSYSGRSFQEKAYMNTITWFEVGLSYGHMFNYSTDETIDVGINVKRLTGINSTSITLSNFDFLYNAKKDITINEADGGYRIVQPGWGVGQGWGVDIGVNYQKKLESIAGYKPNTKEAGCKHIDYKYKLGLSLLDIGAFNVKNNAILQEFSYKAEQFKFDNSKINSFSDFDNTLNSSLTSNSIKQTRGTSYWAWLPFAIGAQFDYNFENHFYVNATTITAFKFANQTKRIDVISVTPRYERKYFEIDLPISLVDYRYPQVGLAFRLGNNLIIGSDRIDSFFGKIRDVYGADIYFHLKFAFFRRCGGKRHYKKSSRTPHCDAY